MLGIGMLEAASHFIDDIVRDEAVPITGERLHSALRVSGAILHQLNKRYGSDDLRNLNDGIVELAYRNDVALTIRQWPRSGEWLRPTTFFNIARTMMHRFAELGFADPPGPLAPDRLPTILDAPTHDVFISVCGPNGGLSYVSPSVLHVLGDLSPWTVSELGMSCTMFKPEDQNRLKLQVDLLLAGYDPNEYEFKTVLPRIPAAVLLGAEKIFDDDDVFMGCMTVMGDARRTTLATRTLALHRQSKRLATHPG